MSQVTIKIVQQSNAFYESLLIGSKRVNAITALGAGTTAQTRAGPPQVFLNGKIVTPQSLIQRKGGSPQRSKHARPPLVKPQTIDEGASENADRTTSGFSSKMHLKRFIEKSFFNLFSHLLIYYLTSKAEAICQRVPALVLRSIVLAAKPKLPLKKPSPFA